MQSRIEDKAAVKRPTPKVKVPEIKAVSRALAADKDQEKPTKVQFRLDAAQAQSVALAGSFNDWNPKRTPMVKEGNCWSTTLTLPRARYEYRFVVDGEWMSDPSALESTANPYGENNSVFTL